MGMQIRMRVCGVGMERGRERGICAGRENVGRGEAREARWRRRVVLPWCGMKSLVSELKRFERDGVVRASCTVLDWRSR